MYIYMYLSPFLPPSLPREYQLGMEIHNGSQQYHDTKVVTFVARFQLENRTPFKLSYLQRHLIPDTRPEKVPCILPSAVMAFHWPRADLDQLLCIRLVLYHCPYTVVPILYHCPHTIVSIPSSLYHTVVPIPLYLYRH